MPILGIQLMRTPFVQIFQKVGRSRLFQKAVTVIHLLAQRLQRIVSVFRRLDNGTRLFIILRAGILRHREIVVQQAGIPAELRLLWINKHQLQFRWPLGIQQRCHNYVQPHGFTLLCRSGNQQMRGIGQIKYLHIAGYLFADGYRQFSLAGQEFLRCHQFANRHG